MIVGRVVQGENLPRDTAHTKHTLSAASENWAGECSPALMCASWWTGLAPLPAPWKLAPKALEGELQAFASQQVTELAPSWQMCAMEQQDRSLDQHANRQGFDDAGKPPWRDGRRRRAVTCFVQSITQDVQTMTWGHRPGD